MIKELNYEDVKHIKIETYGVDVVENGTYYGYYVDDKLVSIINVLTKNNYCKLRVNYTFPEYRSNGYFTKLLEYIIKKYDGYKLSAGCLDSSYPIYEKLGFIKTNEKQFKYFKVHYMLKE